MGSRLADFVAFDLETTGLSPKSDRVIEVGAVRFDSDLRLQSRFEVLVDPSMPIPLAVQRLTGLTDRDVVGAASPLEAMAQLADFCDGAHLVAHGGMFDIAFCAALLPQAFANRPVYDTLDLARILLPVAPSHSLPLLSQELDIAHERPHRALSDAETTGQVFAHLVALAGRLPGPLLQTMRQVAAEATGPLHDFFARVVAGEGSAAAPAPRGPATASHAADPRHATAEPDGAAAVAAPK